ncbi:hybrid sensor histidine kinase/response regulator [Ramlibacter humi]|nr:response regulator [Ramlibacter humi]
MARKAAHKAAFSRGLRGAPPVTSTVPEEKVRLLVIEDSPLDYELLLATLAMQGVGATGVRVETGGELSAALARERWDLVISDHELPGFSSGEALAIVRALPAPPPFIIVSGVIGEETAVDAMRAGADDYLIKGRLARLGTAVRNALAAAQARRDKAEAERLLQLSQQQLANLSQRLQSMLDEERAAIAREIHDDIGGTLTAVRFDIEGLRRHLAPGALPRLERAHSALTEASTAAQRIQQNLRPPSLDAGLAAALEWQVRQYRERHGADVRFEASGAKREVHEAAALAVYRTCQEALTNIAKHAAARSVEVHLHHGAAVVSLEVSDDGRGLDASALLKPGSLGLRGLAERARAAGGGMEIGSGGGRTTLMLWLPRAPAEVAA